MAEEQIRKAAALMRQGQRNEALSLVQAVLKQDKNNVSAWWLMANLLTDDRERQQKALDRVLALDPQHKGALQLRAKITGTSSSQHPQAAPANPAPKTEGDFDWSKLDSKESSKKKEVAEGDKAESNALKMASYLMIGLIILVVGFGIVFGLFPAIQSALRTPPEQIVLNFYRDLFAADYESARQYVCSDKQAEYDVLAEVSAALPNPIVNVDGLTAALVSQTDTTAAVSLAGTITVTVPNEPEALTISLEEFLVMSEQEAKNENLRLENGAWCLASIQ